MFSSIITTMFMFMEILYNHLINYPEKFITFIYTGIMIFITSIIVAYTIQVIIFTPLILSLQL